MLQLIMLRIEEGVMMIKSKKQDVPKTHNLSPIIDSISTSMINQPNGARSAIQPMMMERPIIVLIWILTTIRIVRMPLTPSFQSYL